MARMLLPRLRAIGEQSCCRYAFTWILTAHCCRYGPEAGAHTRNFGETVRNVGVVYIDARGVGRRALIKRAGKRIIKGRLGGGKEVVLGDESTAGGVGQLHVAGVDAKSSGSSKTGSSMSVGGSTKR
jgi:hypothetical protein